jgi:hypothetical protein
MQLAWIRNATLAIGFAMCRADAHAQTPVPLEQEPRHRLVYHDGPVRIFDVQIGPGDTTLYHIHDAPILYVPIQVSPMDIQVMGRPWVGPPSVSRFDGVVVTSDTGYAVQPITHRVTNVGTGPFRLIAIINHRAPGALPVIPTAISPPGTILHESSWFTASQIFLSPSAGSEWYSAPAPMVVVQPGEGRVRVERDAGGPATLLDGRGGWAYLARGTRFLLRNEAGNKPAIVLVVVRESQ